MLKVLRNNQKVEASELNICVVLSGNITIQLQEEIFPIPSKSFFFFNQPFEVIAASPYIEGFILNLDTEFLQNFSDLKTEINSLSNFFQVLQINNIDGIKNLLNSISKIEENTQLRNSYLHILTNDFISNYKYSLKEKSVVEQFSDLIEQHLEKNYCAGTYAEMLDIPLKKLIKEVKKTTEKTPCNFIKEKVIQRAKNLLVNTEDTSQMISYKLGFEDPYYFIKYFKNDTGLTPTQYRKKFNIN
ncbi:helix-turn-helix domain-containing protein [Aureivirga sp. CE67]|uniref:helix-turn-helix domain-containing protein n=1 Tax=Aureivirga sp. CE67 TaxID=1788983 RepID=UPI0018CAC335|nr:AraC family transcriptional regulator [Aureivirga sp. CE67]